MIRVDVGPRFLRTALKLGPQFTAKAEEKLSLVMARFADPHRHSGLGIRKLGPNSYEIRLWLQWRIVFIQESDRLIAYDIMNHDEVRAWLKGRKGN